jgi:hypothetical protein
MLAEVWRIRVRSPIVAGYLLFTTTSNSFWAQLASYSETTASSTHLHRGSILRMSGSFLHFPLDLRLHAVVFKYRGSFIFLRLCKWYSDWLRAGWPGFDSRQRQESFLYSTASKLTLGPTQLHIQWVPGFLSPGVKLTTHLHLLPRSRIVELYLHSAIRFDGVVLN